MKCMLTFLPPLNHQPFHSSLCLPQRMFSLHNLQCLLPEYFGSPLQQQHLASYILEVYATLSSWYCGRQEQWWSSVNNHWHETESSGRHRRSSCTNLCCSDPSGDIYRYFPSGGAATRRCPRQTHKNKTLHVCSVQPGSECVRHERAAETSPDQSAKRRESDKRLPSCLLPFVTERSHIAKPRCSFSFPPLTN